MEEAFQGIEGVLPEPAVLSNPILGGLQRRWRKLTEPRAADFFLREEAGLLEDADVLHHRGKGDAVRASEIGNGGFAQEERSEDGAASGVGERAEGGVEGARILNHMV